MDNSTNSLIKFLTLASDSGLLKFHTARTRKTAIKVLQKILDAHEIEDITKIDFSTLVDRYRFYEKENQILEPVKETSLQTYITRLNSSITDFNKWKKDPDNFSPTHTKKRHNHSIVKPANNNDTHYNHSSPIYIAIRESSFIEINNIPVDLSQKEVEVICEVLKRYSKKNDL